MPSRPIRYLAASVFPALVLLLVGGAKAAAQDRGVHVDPNSPAGKEYKLPLEDARRDAVGGAAPAGGSSQDPPLFGAGIAKRETPEGQPASGSEGSGRASGRAKNEEALTTGQDGGAQATREAGDSGNGLSAGVLTALMALGVLLVGAIVGVSLRAMRGTHQPT